MSKEKKTAKPQATKADGTPIWNVVAPIGDPEAGPGKTRWITVGVAFENPDKFCLQISFVPIGPDWSGRLYLYPRVEDAEEG